MGGVSGGCGGFVMILDGVCRVVARGLPLLLRVLVSLLDDDDDDDSSLGKVHDR